LTFSKQFIDGGYKNEFAQLIQKIHHQSLNLDVTYCNLVMQSDGSVVVQLIIRIQLHIDLSLISYFNTT
jgi:hypothetical protein